MPTLIQLAKSKTIWFSTALTILGIVQQLGGVLPIPAEYQGLFFAAVGLVTAGLRFITTKALSEK